MIQTHQQSAPQAEWKFNVVVYGIPDCQHGHNKFTRTTEDLNKVTDILLKIEAEPSVQDCFQSQDMVTPSLPATNVTTASPPSMQVDENMSEEPSNNVSSNI